MSVATEDLLAASPYQGYAYAYPHKLAYRPLQPPVPLGRVWAEEAKQRVMLYVHVPFCDMRCGFCNLFTQAHPDEDLVAAYLAALTRQASAVRGQLGDVGVAQICLGGGTPTFLSARQLDELFTLLQTQFDARPAAIGACVETSPTTADAERLGMLRAWGVERISLGVQSFVDDEAHSVGRPQQATEVRRALDCIRSHDFPILNIDLMYGLPGQTARTWLQSIQMALNFQPEELYLYPLYVRPLTGLGKLGKDWDDQRLELYRIGRDFLLDCGYQQLSMRSFQRPQATVGIRSTYSCQADATIGLGPGARSYTRALHYSCEYAVQRSGVVRILAHYVRQSGSSFEVADYGIHLDLQEQRRRHLLQSLMQATGLDLKSYEACFATDPRDEFDQLEPLLALELATQDDEAIRLTAAGHERSDAIGPWLYSTRVQRLMRQSALQ